MCPAGPRCRMRHRDVCAALGRPRTRGDCGRPGGGLARCCAWKARRRARGLDSRYCKIAASAPGGSGDDDRKCRSGHHRFVGVGRNAARGVLHVAAWWLPCFETRDPAFKGWEEWNRAASYRVTEIDALGAVESWVDLVAIDGPLVSFRSNWIFRTESCSRPHPRCDFASVMRFNRSSSHTATSCRTYAMHRIDPAASSCSSHVVRNAPLEIHGRTDTSDYRLSSFLCSSAGDAR